MKIKTIDVHGKEWFDKVNGNSYFSARVDVNYGTKKSIWFPIPYQYGYGETYLQEAFTALAGFYCWPVNTSIMTLWRYCRENKIILRASIERGCRKKDVIAYGKE